ncbi:MAG: HU family DNA-binding protein [Pelotomaculum sp.]|nr:HU family DNA-binding protein [Pelotomaculum sp.]
MTKTEMIRAVAEKAGLKRDAAAQAVDAVLESIQEAVSRGEEVRVPGFGAFVVVNRAERKGRNPQTGEEITIPARKAVAFRPGKGLREAVAS